MNTESQTVLLCMDGTRAEYEGRAKDAATLYQQAWHAAQDDCDRCVAAHYMARFPPTPEEALHWNQAALAHAERVGDDRVATFFPSLYVNLGRSYELLGDEVEAERFYTLAAELGLTHKAVSPSHTAQE